MLNRIIWILMTMAWIGFDEVKADKLECPAPTAQTARDVDVETRVKLATLGRLGALEIHNKTHATVKPLLEKIPNADRIVMANMLISLLCQLLSADNIESKEKLDRFEAFSKQVLGLVTPIPVTETVAPNRPARLSTSMTKKLPKEAPGDRQSVPPLASLKAIGPGASVKEVGEYLEGRQVEWRQAKPYRVSFVQDVGDVSFTEEIIFDDNGQAVRHLLSAKSERITGRNPKTIGRHPREFCEAAPQRIMQSLSDKLGAPSHPLLRISKIVPMDWSFLGYDSAPCNPVSFSTCQAEARATTNRAAFEFRGSQIAFVAKLTEVDHRRARKIGSKVYVKSSLTCELSIDDPEFSLLRIFDTKSTKANRG